MYTLHCITLITIPYTLYLTYITLDYITLQCATLHYIKCTLHYIYYHIHVTCTYIQICLKQNAS